MVATSSLSLEIRDNTGILTLDMPDKSANILSASVLDELSDQLDKLESMELDGLVICSAKPGIFIAGADIREFRESLANVDEDNVVQMCRRGQTLFGRLSKLPYPSVAAIAGVCVGGGAELAVWCDYRVLANTKQSGIGFPEVKLGLFPGWGGTARLPRMIGLANAVEMITGGETANSVDAYKSGLADVVVEPAALIDAAVAMARQKKVSGEFEIRRAAWEQPLQINETEMGFLGATASAMIQQQTKGHYPAPNAALELMLETASLDIEQACLLEAKNMAKLFGSPINAALINVFFLNDHIKKDPGVSDCSIEPRSISHAGVVGAGIMGAGITSANLKRGVTATVTDANAEVLNKAGVGILQEASYDRELKASNPETLAKLAPSLNLATEVSGLARCDLVIEAVVENPKIKDAVLSALSDTVSSDAIIASNTSTIPISELAKSVSGAHRFCGIHFFNPVRRMQLVEVIRGADTDDQTIATSVAYAKRIGKLPIVLNDGPGFLVNRILLPYMNEALLMLAEGASIKNIDKAAQVFGMPMGPFTLYDVVGIDTAYFAGQTMVQAFPDRVVNSDILKAMVEANRLGQKTKQGFFAYTGRKSKKTPDPTVAVVLEPHITSQNEFDLDAITQRLFLTMLVEASRVIEDKIVRNVRDVDFGLIYGIGFPPFKGGLLNWADTVGIDTIVEQLKPLEPLGKRFAATELLLDLAKSNSGFYSLANN